MALTDKECIQINQALFSLVNAYGTHRVEVERRQSTGLTLSDRAVIMVLGQFPLINSRRLSELMRINPGTISVYVQRLVNKGLIEKTQDEADRRNWLLQLTEYGGVVFQDTISATEDFTRDFMTVLDEEEQKTLHKLLLKVSHSMGYTWQ